MTQAAPICLVTRPSPQAELFAKAVRDRFGIETVISPLIEIRPLRVSIDFDSLRGLILTSANASRLLAELQAPKSIPCFAVGGKTARVARSFGYLAQEEGRDADSLVSRLKIIRPDAPLMHLRGEHSRGDVAGRLMRAGISCREAIVYRQLSRDITRGAQAALERGTTVLLPLFSPRTASIFATQVEGHESIYPIAMSNAVKEAFVLQGTRDAVVAEAPTEDEMLNAMARLAPMRARVEKARMRS